MTRYFAYGANMDPVHMAHHAPGALHQGMAVLPDHAFGIAAGGVGTVRQARGESVHGVLWELTPQDVAALDRFEGVSENFYRCHTVLVLTPDGEVLAATIYRPTDDGPGTPQPGYLERIIEVGNRLAFPPEYIASLTRWLA